jgi:hypothetical protein
MIEEEEYSILQNKFQEWFRGIVPAALPSPTEADHSIKNPVPSRSPHSVEVDPSIVNPIIPSKENHTHYSVQRSQEDNNQKLLELLGFGFKGAISFGAVVGFILFILNFSLLGWYSNNWPNQIIVIFFALLLGFYIGLSKGFVHQQRKRYFYKGEL